MADVSVSPLADAAPGAVHFDFSMMGLFMQADTVVKTVLVVLGLFSVWCWAVIIEKLWRLVALRRAARRFKSAINNSGAGAEGDALVAELLAVATREWRDEGAVPGLAPETRAERHGRINHAMRTTLGEALRSARQGLPVLATTGSAAPFIGLFGTVWGIMNSFANIAQSQNTSLAVVAPGIAEALFATAVGLVAAIPATIAYNKLATGFGTLTQQFAVSIDRFAAELAKRPVASGHGHIGEATRAAE